jgi:hypothetical protein
VGDARQGPCCLHIAITFVDAYPHPSAARVGGRPRAPRRGKRARWWAAACTPNPEEEGRLGWVTRPSPSDWLLLPGSVHSSAPVGSCLTAPGRCPVSTYFYPLSKPLRQLVSFCCIQLTNSLVTPGGEVTLLKQDSRLNSRSAQSVSLASPAFVPLCSPSPTSATRRPDRPRVHHASDISPTDWFK